MVDISIATTMMVHASRGNMDVAVLVAGDEDYVPLVQALKTEGCQVILWFLQDGLSPHLSRAADYFFDLSPIFKSENFNMGWV